MAILNRLFERSPAEDVTKSLGNMLISGVENEGSRKLYNNMLMNMLHEKKTILLVNGLLSKDQHNRIVNFVKPHMIDGTRTTYDLNLSESSDRIDIMSAFHTSDQKAGLIVELMSMVTGIPDSVKIKAHRFYLCAIKALDALGEEYSVKDLSTKDIDYVLEKVSEAPLSEEEKRRCNRFLEDASTYAAYSEIETYMFMLESSGLLDVLSGDVKVEKMLNDGNVVMLNGMISDDFDKKEQLFNVLFYSLSKCLETLKSKSRVAFLIKDADFISGDYVKTVLHYNKSYNYAAYIFAEDISRYISKNGNAVLDDSNSFLVFTQGSDENALFWSAIFGNRDVQKKSFSYTKKKGLLPFSTTFDSGGVIASPRKYNSATTSFQKVNEPIYKPEVFKELKPNEVMVYLREPLMRRKSRIEE